MPLEEKTFPGPRGHWLRGCIRQMQADPLGFYSKAWREHGDYVRIRAVRGIDCYLLTHPDAVEHVLHKGHRNYRKPAMFYKSVGLLVGNGLFTNEGESWASQRRLAAPAFHPYHLSKLCGSIVACAEGFTREAVPDESKTREPGRFSLQATARLATSDTIDIAEAMMKLGLRIASTTLFSWDISGEADQVGQAFRVAFSHVGNRMNSLQLIPAWMPTRANRAFGRARLSLDRVVKELIDSRRRMSEQPADLLTELMSAVDEKTGRGMTERMLMDEVLTLLTAGHENIGAALAWTWYLLAAHPRVQEDLYHEIHGRLGGRAIEYADISALPLLTAVFQESLRLYPPGWGEMRETIEADDVNGYRIPGKSMIILCQSITHRHAAFWENPDRFDPVRFMPGAKDRHRFAFFPFGGGPRICIGMQLAMIQGALVIATVSQKFRVELVDGQTVEPDATFTLRPRFGVQVRLILR